MPNVNFTSSSIAQQDRFAQTTVSYESRNMQAIPFYPDVDHKAKFRGILILCLLWSIIIGAVLGLVYGYRDVIFDAAESSGVSAWFGGSDDETAAAYDEDVDFSLAASSVESDDMIEAETKVWDYVYPYEKDLNTFTYNGAPQSLKFWNDADQYIIKEAPYDIKLTFSYLKDGTNATTPKVITSENDWPTDAGKYVVWVTATAEGKSYSYQTLLTINKATQNDIKYPGLVYPQDGTAYTGEKFTLGIKDSAQLEDLGIAGKVTYQISYTDTFGKSHSVTASNIINAGKYTVIVKIGKTDNTEEIIFKDEAVTFNIAKARFPVDTYVTNIFKDGSFTFDGEKKTLEIDETKLPQDLFVYNYGTPVYTYSYEDGPNATFFDNKNAVNHGTYRVSAYISSNNYKDKTVYATLTINKATLTSYYTAKNGTMIYDGKWPDKSDGLYLTTKNMPDCIIIDYKFFDNANKNIGSETAIKNVGTYKVEATLSRKSGTADNYTLPDTIKYNFTVKKADINLSGVTVKPLTSTYTGKRFLFPEENVTVTGLADGDKIGTDTYDVKITIGKIKDLSTGNNVTKAIDAGSYEVTITLSGSNYNTTTTVGKIIIEKASFGDLLNVNLASNQQIKKDGKEHLPTIPKYSFSNNFEPVELDTYFIFEGKEIALNGEGGPSKLGDHNVILVISDKNHEDRFDMVYTIKFNPMTIVMGIVLGVIVGFIIALLILMSYRGLEKRSFNNFKGVRLRLQHERGGDRGAIVCEGRVMIINFNSEQEHRDFPWIVEPRFGRLFLTHATLEYYDSSCSGRNIKSYKNYRNFLIQLKDVTGVEIRGTFFRSKLIVFARGARHVFYVEPNTAYLWRRDIMHFRDLAHLYPMENNVVDNNYPFNYTLLRSDEKDTNVPDNV